MYRSKLEHQCYIIIIITIFSVSLIIPSVYETAHGAFINNARLDTNIYYDSNSRIYVDVPGSWTLNEQANNVLLMGDGILLGIMAYTPTLGTSFPSLDTPIEQVANTMINDLQYATNLRLDYHAPITISNVPAYQLSYTQVQQEGESMLIDKYILIDGPYLYSIQYVAPESLYNQNIPVRESILRSMAFGDTFDAEIVPLLNSLSSLQIISDHIADETVNVFSGFQKDMGCLKQSTSNVIIGDPKYQVYDANCGMTYFTD